MFRYFPTNYVWNLSVDLAIEMGARIGEIEEMCAPLSEASKQPDASGTRAFVQSWVAMGNKLCDLAAGDERRGRLIWATIARNVRNSMRACSKYSREGPHWPARM